MRQRGNQIKVEQVLLGLLLTIAIVALGIFMGDDDPYREGAAFEEVYEPPTVGGTVNQIGSQKSAKQTQINKLNQKMIHDLDLQTIE